MITDTHQCTSCQAQIDALAVFPGGICVQCHEKKFDAEVARNGGILPKPDFTRVLSTRRKRRP